MQIDPRQMKKMMAQMGINTQEIDAKRVIIEKEDERIVITGPSVVKISGQGDTSYQIGGGQVSVEPMLNEEDVKLVAQQSGTSEEAARKALQETEGDVAEAIMKLKK